MTPNEPNECYGLNLTANERIASARIPKQPKPLHRTFYQTIGATTNRETDRWNIRHNRIHRITGRTDKANKIKRQVKSIRLRHYVDRTISHFLRSK